MGGWVGEQRTELSEVVVGEELAEGTEAVGPLLVGAACGIMAGQLSGGGFEGLSLAGATP